MCSEMDFTQEKSNFHPNTRIPNSSASTAAALSKSGWMSVSERHKELQDILQGHEKCIFETPHNDIKCVLSIIESYSIEKNGSKFSHLLTVRAKGANPPPPLQSA